MYRLYNAAYERRSCCTAGLSAHKLIFIHQEAARFRYCYYSQIILPKTAFSLESVENALVIITLLCSMFTN